jgi:crossover junction endodeoxyribonuclease RuvC
MRVLGIDPSLQSTGFGIVEEQNGRLLPVAFGVIKPTAGLPLHLKLAEIKSELEELIRTYAPEEAPIENAFTPRT